MYVLRCGMHTGQSKRFEDTEVTNYELGIAD